MSLLPEEDGMELIHSRDYEVKVYRAAPDELVARGAVSDRKPPGLYVADDPSELEVHQMHVELRVHFPTLEIKKANVTFATHPHTMCPLITEDYKKLEGLSVARGFLRKTKDLFGGPNGCTHTNALIQAMAPAIVQSTWSIRIELQRTEGKKRSELSVDERKRRVGMNLNTCHVWDEDGERVRRYLTGDLDGETMLPIEKRLAELGREDDPAWG